MSAISDIREQVALTGDTVVSHVQQYSPSITTPSFWRVYASAWLVVLVGMVVIEPAAAAKNKPCKGPFLTTVQNATTWLTVAGPTVGGANAGYNMLKAGGTNKAQNKKEYKENIRSSIVYGLAAGMITGIINLIVRWGPQSVQACQ